MIDSLRWCPTPEATARSLAATLVDATHEDPLNRFEVAGKTAPLPFYRHWKILQLQFTYHDAERTYPADTLYALWREGRPPLLLDGSSGPVFLANADETLQIDASTVLDYLRFFCFAVRGESGAFLLFETAPETMPPGADDVARLAQPLTLRETSVGESLLAEGTMVYAGNAFHSVLSVEPTGEVTMLDDDPLAASIPAQVLPTLPPLGLGAFARGQLSAERAALVRARSAVTVALSTPSVRPPLTELVELLLERALRSLSHNRLIEHFNAIVPSTDVLQQFAALVVDASPVVIVETDIPFVEETLAEIVAGLAKTGRSSRVCRATVGGDESPVSFDLPPTGPALVLVPLQVYRQVAQVERLAFEIATKEMAAIIACERFGQLPECLRRLKDIVLRLPATDVEIFEALFGRIMGEPPPSDWQSMGTAWVKHLLHTDFEHPRRMKLSCGAAFDYIRSQVAERLYAVDATQGLSLHQLQGLGEARQFAEDLIADIHAAIDGRIPWSQVDRGALLVGPPGTGKTTVARAIAKDCGVRFISASPTGWQAEGGSLGPHIAAIRRTFSEARRYSPSILFIDEIDSIGNREDFAGTNNSVYQTEIVNALLEQMQGLDPEAPVFVIGATNLEERIDPALRRAGRLDRVIRIPRPNSVALEHIYRHYIASQSPTTSTGSNIDTRALGRLSVGLTGADVERIVRGALRRARKAGRPTTQNDLIAEITNKPRDSSSSRRLTTEEIERTAVHEAGHALAHFLTTSGGSEIGFVTVVPRDNGTLGFVASLPDERAHLVRSDYEDRLDILMAGRAAEALRYGEAGISSGAAGDLKSATMLVSSMIAQLGLSSRPKLLWSESMSDQDLKAAEETLLQSHDRVFTKLKAHESRLLRLVEELVVRQELSGDEVRAILARH